MLITPAIYFPGGWEWIVILIVALLIFGKRLPDVGKSLGKGIVEFKKGLKGMKDEMDSINDEVDDAVNKDETPEPAKLDADHSESPYHPDNQHETPVTGETRKDKAEAEA